VGSLQTRASQCPEREFNARCDRIKPAGRVAQTDDYLRLSFWFPVGCSSSRLAAIGTVQHHPGPHTPTGSASQPHGDRPSG